MKKKKISKNKLFGILFKIFGIIFVLLGIVLIIENVNPELNINAKFVANSMIGSFFLGAGFLVLQSIFVE